MRGKRVALAAALVASIAAPVADEAPPKQRGVSWVGGGQPVTAQDFDRLVGNGVQWIAQNPFGWVRALDTPEILLRPDSGLWGETDAGLARTTALARERGIRTLLRPHLFLAGPSGHGGWVGDIAMRSEEDWTRWFDSYRAFILHYAHLAKREKVDLLCIGAELKSATRGHEAAWRRIIGEVRAVYPGPLTYAANWDREFEEIPFWDALDYIGIQAYFPLAQTEGPTLDVLKEGWRPHLAAIDRIARRVGKPVIFTEIGYRSMPDTAIRPWEWGELRSREAATPEGLRTQADAYEAFFQMVWRSHWLAGAYFWKWYPGLERRDVPPGREFSPQNKPAERVMATWFGGLSPGSATQKP